MRSDQRIRVYPEYFDSTLTRREGRRIPKKKAIENPTINELKIAGQKLGYSVETDSEVAYPRSWRTPKGVIYLTNESGEKIKTKKKGQILTDLSITVTSYARPKILEYLKQKEQQLKASKKPGLGSKTIEKKPEKHKPSRRRR